jgi:hypothetical protein
MKAQYIRKWRGNEQLSTGSSAALTCGLGQNYLYKAKLKTKLYPPDGMMGPQAFIGIYRDGDS